ncbi:hypothetical protein AaE_012249, partial [Aphanomyces astaci]
MYPLPSQHGHVRESSTSLPNANNTSTRTRFQLDVVLEHVLLSHKVALTDKQLRIIVQRDNKRIQSDASSWRNERADFQQVVGLQSTLTLLRTQQLAQPHQPLYEPKVYKFLIQAVRLSLYLPHLSTLSQRTLPSQSQVASFELDITHFVNQNAS